MGNWKKILTSNVVRAKDLVSDNIDPEGGTILRSMNGSLEWINQTQFGNITYAGIGGDVEGFRNFFVSSVNPYGHIMNVDSLDPQYHPTDDPEFMHRRNINGHYMSNIYGINGTSGNSWDISLESGYADIDQACQVTGHPVPDYVFNFLAFPGAYCDLLVNSPSLKRSGEWHADANHPDEEYTGLRTYGFLNTDIENGGNNPETNAIATITSHKRIMSVHFQGTWTAQPDFEANSQEDTQPRCILIDCKTYAKPELVILVSPLIPLGESNNNNWQTHEYNGAQGVPLYSLVNAAGEEAIFTPTDMTGDSDMTYNPNNTEYGDGGGWTTDEIENRSLGMATRFPDINGSSYTADITKEGLDFEILCPEGYFRNVYLACGLRLCTVTQWENSSSNVLGVTRLKHFNTQVFEQSTPTGYIVMSSTSSTEFGNNTYNSANL
tara:strand:- start:1622 stop:2932 length:1311 start_codon:yes stop_codon:yes gene_type:complete